MIRRIICTILALIMVQVMIVGCATSDNPAITTSNSKNQTIQSEKKEPEETSKTVSETTLSKNEEQETETITTIPEEITTTDITQPQDPITTTEVTQPKVTTQPEVSAKPKETTSVPEVTEIPETTELTKKYLHPDSNIVNLEQNDTNIYENMYVKVDATNAKQGYLIFTYKDPWADKIEIGLEEIYAHTNIYRMTHRYKYSKEDFENNQEIIIPLPATDAIYYIVVVSTINETMTIKMSVNVGQLTVDGAITYEDMEPTEEMIKLKETEAGVYSNKYVRINTNTSDQGYFILDYIEPNADDIRIKVTSNVQNEKGQQAKWECKIKEKGTCTVKVALPYGNSEYNIVVSSAMENESTGFGRVSTKAELTITPNNVPEKDVFLLSTGEVLYDSEMMFIKKADEIAADCKDDFEVVAKIYDWVTEYISYGITEYTARGFYICDLEEIYETGVGNCYDYAVVFAAMVRSQGIPCKVVFGQYANSMSADGHAWNEVYISSEGSIKTEKLSIEGNKWCTLDPTYTSSSNDSGIVNYMNDPENYIWESYY